MGIETINLAISNNVTMTQPTRYMGIETPSICFDTLHLTDTTYSLYGY